MLDKDSNADMAAVADGNVDMAAVAEHDPVAKKLAQEGKQLMTVDLDEKWTQKGYERIKKDVFGN